MFAKHPVSIGYTTGVPRFPEHLEYHQPGKYVFIHPANPVSDLTLTVQNDSGYSQSPSVRVATPIVLVLTQLTQCLRQVWYPLKTSWAGLHWRIPVLISCYLLQPYIPPNLTGLALAM